MTFSRYILAGQELPADVRSALARCALTVAVDGVDAASAGVVEAEFLSPGDVPVGIGREQINKR